MNKYLVTKQPCRILIQLIQNLQRERKNLMDIIDAQEALKQQMLTLIETRDWSNEIGLRVNTRNGMTGTIKQVNAIEPKIVVIDSTTQREERFWSNEVSVDLPQYIFNNTKRI